MSLPESLRSEAVDGIPSALVFNLDESGFQGFVDSKNETVVVPRNVTRAFHPFSRQEKCATFLLTVAADESALKPLVLIPRVTIEGDLLSGSRTRGWSEQVPPNPFDKSRVSSREDLWTLGTSVHGSLGQGTAVQGSSGPIPDGRDMRVMTAETTVRLEIDTTVTVSSLSSFRKTDKMTWLGIEHRAYRPSRRYR